jgi:cytochrome c556
MTAKFLNTITIVALLAVSANACAKDNHPQDQSLALSPELRELLRAEMREISGGIQSIALLLATADWEAIQDTSAKIQASFIMKQKLTPALKEELEHALPARFKQLDADFHHRAEKLGMAAAAHDPEEIAFHYSRMLESCTQCHAEFAADRFPGFAPKVSQDHHH